jgi:hypothetical protein
VVAHVGGSGQDAVSLELEADNESGPMVVDSSILTLEMDSSVEKVSDNPRFPRYIWGPTGCGSDSMCAFCVLSYFALFLH